MSSKWTSKLAEYCAKIRADVGYQIKPKTTQPLTFEATVIVKMGEMSFSATGRPATNKRSAKHLASGAIIVKHFKKDVDVDEEELCDIGDTSSSCTAPVDQEADSAHTASEGAVNRESKSEDKTDGAAPPEADQGCSETVPEGTEGSGNAPDGHDCSGNAAEGSSENSAECSDAPEGSSANAVEEVKKTDGSSTDLMENKGVVDVASAESLMDSKDNLPEAPENTKVEVEAAVEEQSSNSTPITPPLENIMNSPKLICKNNDPVGELFRFCFLNKIEEPSYDGGTGSGPENDRTWAVKCKIGVKKFEGVSRIKKESKKLAATKMLMELKRMEAERIPFATAFLEIPREQRLHSMDQREIVNIIKNASKEGVSTNGMKKVD